MILEASHLTLSYRAGHPVLNDVSLSVQSGEILGVAGESGCGKTTLLKALLGLVKPAKGHVAFEGKRMGMIFQNPVSSLDPLMSVKDILREAYDLRKNRTKSDPARVAIQHLEAVELPHAYLSKKPHQMSGGECQRVAIARALMMEPDILLCDEAVSSLDALVRVSILNLLLRVFEERRMACIFVSHDLRVIRHLCDRVLILQSGEVREVGSVDQIFSHPKHIYTKELLRASGLA